MISVIDGVLQHAVAMVILFCYNRRLRLRGKNVGDQADAERRRQRACKGASHSGLPRSLKRWVFFSCSLSMSGVPKYSRSNVMNVVLGKCMTTAEVESTQRNHIPSVKSYELPRHGRASVLTSMAMTTTGDDRPPKTFRSTEYKQFLILLVIEQLFP